MGLLNNSNAIESGGYNIDRSLRFRSSASAYLSRTSSATPTGAQSWTISTWVKRGALGVQSRSFLGANVGPNYTSVTFLSTDALRINYSNGVNAQLVTTQVFRDISAWYHIVIAADSTNATASNRIKLYVNGQQITSFSTANYPVQNTASEWNFNSSIQTIGTAAIEYFDGYLAEVNFIDGQALTPSSFGQTDAVTGVWIPKKYTGTYGTNGFYLDFKNNTSATTLAYDKSGNGNNWTANNISTTAGATYDSMTDVPTLTSATAANYCVLNPLSALNSASTYMSQANLAVLNTQNVSNWKTVFATIGINIGDGKFYWETTIPSSFGSGIGNFSGIANLTDNGAPPQTSSWSLYWNTSNFQKQVNSTGTTLTGTPATNDVLGIAYDAVNGQIWFSRNNTWFEGNPSAGTGASYTGISASVRPYVAAYTDAGSSGLSGCYVNFGQRPFSYTPPTGFKALNTFNLPDPVIKKPNQYMDVKLDTGANIKGAAESTFTGDDLIWIKDRANANNHQLIDTVRGSTAVLQSNTTAAETTYSTPSGNSVAWCWKESATSGFDIVTYTGNGSTPRNISHSLGAVPSLIITKKRGGGGSGGLRNWPVRHKSVTDAFGNTECLFLNLTNSRGTQAQIYTTAPTSAVYSVGSDTEINENGQDYVAYLFAEIAGFSKFGSYTGNGSADGPFVYCGFRPKYVLQKRVDSSNDWYHHDTSQNEYNVAVNNLLLNSSTSQSTVYNWIDITSSGFKCRTADGGSNASGGTYIYAAFAESPFKTSNAR